MKVKHNTVESYFLEFLFNLIDKWIENKMNFFEWLLIILTFCAGNDEFLTKIIFKMIDKNN